MRAVAILVARREGKVLFMTVEDENPRVVTANLALMGASLTVRLILIICWVFFGTNCLLFSGFF